MDAAGPRADNAPAMTIPETIAGVLGPHLGAMTADAVARHLCAKHGISEDSSPAQQAELKEVLRRGLVAYVGAEHAAQLASECIAQAFSRKA
jgi:hypothetical protein